MRVKRIKISDYILLEDRSQYDFLIRYADIFNKPENVLKLPPVEEMPFGFVKETQSEIMQGMTLGREIEILSKFISLKDVYLDEYTRTAKWFYKQLEDLTYKEMTLLSSNNQMKGSDKLQPIALYVQKRTIAKELNITIEEVDNMKYADAFVELYTQKILNDIHNENIRHNKSIA